jgi:hypothetical protein
VAAARFAPEAWLELPDSSWLPDPVSIEAELADLSEEDVRRLPEEEADEEPEGVASLDIRLEREKQKSHDWPPREDLRVRGKSKKKGK